LHDATTFGITVCVTGPAGYQRIDQYIFSKLALVHAVDSDVTKEGRFASGAGHVAIVVGFADVAPVVDIANAFFVIDVSIIVAKACLTQAALTVGTIVVVGI
jgi:hypothetical protein